MLGDRDSLISRLVSRSNEKRIDRGGATDTFCIERARMTETRTRIECCCALLVMVLVSACSKNDADATGSEVILTDTPVARSSVWVDPTLKDGKAEWHPFRVPEDKPPVEAKAGSKGVGEKGGTAGGEANGVDAAKSKEIEETVRDLIKDHNDLIAEGKLDDALEYWIASQRETVKQAAAALAKAKEALQKVSEALKAKLPDAGDRVSKAIAGVDASLSLAIRVDSIQVKSATEAEGFLAASPATPAQRFKQIEDEWYLEVPEEVAPAFVAGAEKIAPMFDAITSALQGGAPAESVLQQLETMGTMIGGVAKPAGEGTREGEAEADGS